MFFFVVKKKNLMVVLFRGINISNISNRTEYCQESFKSYNGPGCDREAQCMFLL